MHKCNKCGTEFEGKFCPECGTKWEDFKICPQCGADLKGDTKFCPECGYSFVADTAKSAPSSAPAETSPAAEETAAATAEAVSPSATPQEEVLFTPVEPEPTYTASPSSAQSVDGEVIVKTPDTFITKLYKIMRFLPSLLLLGFGVLSLLFFLASAGQASAFGESESFGSVYKVAFGGEVGIDGLKGTCIGLIAVTFLTLIFAAIFTRLTLSPASKGKSAKIAGKEILVSDILTIVGLVLYLVLFIMACVGCGQIKGSLGDAGDYAAELGIKAGGGAGLVLVIVFGIIFLLLSAACLVTRFILGKKNPQWVADEKQTFEEQAKDAAAKKSAAHASASAATATAGAGAGETVTMTDLPVDRQMKTLKDVKKITARSAILRLLPVCFFPAAIIVFIIVAIVTPFTANTDKWNPRELNINKRNFKTWAIVYGILGGAMLILVIVGLFTFLPTLYFLIPIMGIVMGGVIGLYAGLFLFASILSICTLPVINKLKITFYGRSNAVVSYDPVLVDVAVLHKTKAQISEHVIAGKKPGADAVSIVYPFVAILLAGLMTLICFLSIGDMIFNSTRYVEKIILGVTETSETQRKYDSQYNVTEKLGMPDNLEKGESYSSLNHFEYYSSSYRKINNRMKKLSEQAEDAIMDGDYDKIGDLEEEYNKIAKDAASIEFSMIYVNFGKDPYSDYSSDCVTEVVLMRDIKGSDMMGDYYASSSSSRRTYTVEKVELSKNAISIFDAGNSGGGLSAKVWFTDGSFHNSYINPTILPNATGTKYTLTWTDSVFGTEITKDMNVTNTSTGTYHGVNYTLTASGATMSDIKLELELSSSSSSSGTLYDSGDNYRGSSYSSSSYSDLPGWYSYMSAITTMEVRGNFTSIEGEFFSHYPSLRSLTLPSSIKYVEENALSGTSLYSNPTNWKAGALYVSGILFSTNSSLADNYTIVDGTTAVADMAFAGRTSLAALTIPSSVEYVGEYQFSDSANVMVIVAKTESAVNSNYNSRWNLYTNNYSRNHTTYYGQTASPTTESGVTYLGTVLLSADPTLTEITVKSGTTEIASGAFASCANLRLVKIPSSVTRIGSRLFNNTGTLVAVDENASSSITSSLQTQNGTYMSTYNIVRGSYNLFDYEDGVLYNGTTLYAVTYDVTAVNVRAGTEEIATRAFYNDTDLTFVSIPATVTYVGSNIFNTSNMNLSNLNVYIAASSDSGWNTAWDSGLSSYSSHIHYDATPHTVTFRSMGNVVGTTLQDRYFITEDDLPEITRSGYVLVGWSVGSTVSDNNYITFTDGYYMLSGGTSVTLYANWKQSSNAYTITNDNSYPWAQSGNNYTSTNKADRSSSQLTLRATGSITVTFTYNVSSESYDHLKIYKNSTSSSALIDVSGYNNNDRTYTIQLTSGDSLIFVYSKDNSNANGDDCAYIKNLIVYNTNT